MAQRDMVTRTEAERAYLLPRTTNGKVSARQLPRAHILLQADAGRLETVRATARQVGMATVARSASAAPKRASKPRCGSVHALGDRAGSLANRRHAGARAGSTPPAGRPSWTRP